MSKPIQLTAADMTKEALQEKGTILVDFWAPWCGPCRMVAPIVAEIAEELAGKVKVCKVDVDQNQELAMQYKVASIPTLILFRDGAAVSGIVGVRPKEVIMEMLGQ